MRRLALPRSVKHWSLTTLREKLIKIGAKAVRHAKYLTFQMAEAAMRASCSRRSSTASIASACRQRWCHVADAATERRLAIHGGRGRSRLNRAGRLDTMAVWGSIDEGCRLQDKIDKRE